MAVCDRRQARARTAVRFGNGAGQSFELHCECLMGAGVSHLWARSHYWCSRDVLDGVGCRPFFLLASFATFNHLLVEGLKHFVTSLA